MTDEEIDALCLFKKFMLGYKSNDSRFIKDEGVGFDIGRFSELIGKCPKDNIIFDLNLWKPDGWWPECFNDYNGIVQFLFDKVELYGWVVNAVQYVDMKCVDMKSFTNKKQSLLQKVYTFKDRCQMWLSPPKETVL